MKLLNFFKENKILTIFLVIFVVFFVFMIIILSGFIGGNNVSEYGDRLKGIDKVKISEKQTKKLEKELKADEKVEEAKYNLKGRRINIIITFNNASIDEAKDIGNRVLGYFSDEEKAYYDIQVYLNSKEEKEGFPLIGYKHKTRDAINWD